MNSYINCKELIIDDNCKKRLSDLCKRYMNHEFNLLGSGFVNIRYGMKIKGFRNKKYIYNSRYNKHKMKRNKIKKRTSTGYEPLNWFIDFKSGFYFEPYIYNSAKRNLAVIENKYAVDIKCPWELGRLQHLVQLAVFAVCNLKKRERIIQEFKDEIYDFILSNPIGKTVQWACAMDSSIRIVNMLVSYDLLKQIDREHILDSDFDLVFEKFIFESAKFVLDHLEYAGEKWPSGNHYLSDIVGIAYAAAYLPNGKETDAWLAFAVQELIKQFQRQFYEEGSNFEGSTSYHRLSSELVLYATALIFGTLLNDKRSVYDTYDRDQIERLLSLGRQRYNLKKENFFPQWYLDRLFRAGMFTQNIMNNNYKVVQAGDNDNGRLIKLTPSIRDENFDNVLDHRGLLSGMAAIYESEQLAEACGEYLLEYSFVKALAKGKKIVPREYSSEVTQVGYNEKKILPFRKETLLFDDKRSDSDSLLKNIRVNYYKDFGIVIFKSDRLYLSMILCSAKNNFMAHNHNDKLSVELLVDGKYITRDSGTYIYTSETDWRNKFRSVKAHNTAVVKNVEQNLFDGTFGMIKRCRGNVIYLGTNEIVAQVQYGEITHTRHVKIYDNRVKVVDYCNQEFSVCFKKRYYSPEYGVLSRIE